MVANRATVCLRRLDAMEPTDAVRRARHRPQNRRRGCVIPLTRLMASGTHAGGPGHLLQHDLPLRYRTRARAQSRWERLRNFDYAFTAVDLNAFMTRFTTEYPDAARWTEATVKH